MRPERLLAVVVVIAGCGGSGEGDGRLSRTELIAQGDAICVQYRAEIQDLGRELDATRTGGTISDEAYARVLPKVADSLRKMVGDLRALRVPENIETSWETALIDIEASADRFDKAATAASDGAHERLTRLLRNAEEGQQATAFVKDYGFKECGS